MSDKFWKWRPPENALQEEAEVVERVMELYGTIAEESWFDDDVTPKMFHDELFSGEGPVTVWLNSPGGDCVAASQIYAMLMDYKGDVTIKIDGIAASAASVIAMAGTRVLMAPTALMMIHNPMTMAFGDHGEMEKAIEMLGEVKESIINAYELRTGLDRKTLSKLMEAETWMNAGKAVELGFADGIIEGTASNVVPAYAFSQKQADVMLYNKAASPKRKEKEEQQPKGRSADALKEKLEAVMKVI